MIEKCTNQTAGCTSGDEYFPKYSLFRRAESQLKTPSDQWPNSLMLMPFLSCYFNYNDSGQTALDI